MSIAEEFDRPTRDDLQEDRLKALEADRLNLLEIASIRAKRPMSDEGYTQADLRDAQTRVLDTSIRQVAMQISDLTIGQQIAAQKVSAAEMRMAALEKALGANTEITREVRDLLDALKGGMKVLGWMGTGLKWLGAIAAAGMAIYTGVYMLTHGGELPGARK